MTKADTTTVPIAPTILLVDDMPANLAVMVSHLEHYGYQVVVALNGEEAIRRATFVRPDLILLDVMMPRMDGFETCRCLKASEATRDIPVIFMTALSDVDDKVTAFKAGGIDYVTKPFEIAEVMARIRTHLSLRSLRQQVEIQNDQLRHENTIRREAEDAARRALAALQESEERYRLLVELSPDAILLARGNRAAPAEDGGRPEGATRTEGPAQPVRAAGGNRPGCNERIVFANAAATELLGAERNSLIGQDLLALVAPAWRQEVATALSGLRPGWAIPDQEEQALRHDGSLVDVAVTRIAFSDQGARAIQVVMRNISDRKRLEEQLRHQATHDELTGLPNRTLRIDRLRQAIALAGRTGQRFAVCFVDVDHFKAINDTHGHEGGDTVLRTVATRMVAGLRSSDTVARFGGDEFVLLLHPLEDSVEQARAVLKRMMGSLSEPISLGEGSLRASVSIGCSIFPEAGTTIDALCKYADVAMYRAKQAGRNALEIYAPPV